MSVDKAAKRINDLAKRVLRVRSNALRAEIYGVLEEARVGRGRVYIARGLRKGETRDDGDFMAMGPYGLFPARMRSKPHHASAPGDPAARDTGRLMESIRVVSLDEKELLALVGPDPSVFEGQAYYPVYLEFGTRGMAPRPFMRPALERFKQAISSGEGRPA